MTTTETTTNNGRSSTATVQTLTAEVRVLQVGSRQITMSVFNQLDSVLSDKIERPLFGRISPRDAERFTIDVIGRHTDTGALVRCRLIDPNRISKKILKELTKRYDRSGNDYYCKIPFDAYVGPAEAMCDGVTRYVQEPDWHNCGWGDDTTWESAFQDWYEIINLPLIVLAGLR